MAGAPVVVEASEVVEASAVVGTELLVAPVVPVLLVAVLVVAPVVPVLLVVVPVVPVLALVVAVLALVVVVAGFAVVLVAGLAVVVVGSTWQPGVPWPASALHPMLPLAAAGPVYIQLASPMANAPTNARHNARRKKLGRLVRI
jgi:hypothetical protein